MLLGSSIPLQRRACEIRTEPWHSFFQMSLCDWGVWRCSELCRCCGKSALQRMPFELEPCCLPFFVWTWLLWLSSTITGHLQGRGVANIHSQCDVWFRRFHRSHSSHHCLDIFWRRIESLDTSWFGLYGVFPSHFIVNIRTPFGDSLRFRQSFRRSFLTICLLAPRFLPSWTSLEYMGLVLYTGASSHSKRAWRTLGNVVGSGVRGTELVFSTSI